MYILHTADLAKGDEDLFLQMVYKGFIYSSHCKS